MTAQPATLLQLAGAKPAPTALGDAALLLIDCQNEYVSGALPLPGVGAALNEIERLCQRARAGDTPIIHVRQLGRSGGLFDPSTQAGAFAAPLAVGEAETVIEKTLPNAFAGTHLAEAIAATQRKQLIVVGFMTHMCISSTVRAALDHGLFCTVVAAATATRDLPAVGGGVVAAGVLQQASLAALADRFAVIAADCDAIPD